MSQLSAIVELLRRERRASVFFVTLTQSSLGTGAAYIALLLIAGKRFDSAWAISLVLAADLLPAMAFGPLFGAVADRFSRRTAMVIADTLRAGAFVGIALVDSFPATIALAALAGVGTALFTPAALAGLPSLVRADRLPAATALYGAIADLGFTVGPALAGLLLLLGDAETILAANGGTFALSALALAILPFGAAPEREDRASGRLGRTLVRDTREGLAAARQLDGVLTVLLATSLAFVFVGMFNVGELFLATKELGASDAGFSILVALFGLGFIAGSLSAARGGPLPALKRQYLAGLAVLGLALLLSGLAPTVAVAGVTFAAAGVGNGLVVVYERMILQARVPDSLAGRVFGLRDGLTASAFGVAFLAAGGLIELIGVRATIGLAGAGTLVAWAIAVGSLRSMWAAGGEPQGELSGGAELADRMARSGGQDSPNLVGTRDRWLAILDDLD